MMTLGWRAAAQQSMAQPNVATKNAGILMFPLVGDSGGNLADRADILSHELPPRVAQVLAGGFNHALQPVRDLGVILDHVFLLGGIDLEVEQSARGITVSGFSSLA